MASDVLQYPYNNQYRRHSAIGLPSRHQFPDTEYDDKYVKLDNNSYVKLQARPNDNLQELQGLNFAAKTENSEYNFRPVTRSIRARSEYNMNRRKEGEWPQGITSFTTENKENYKQNKMDKIVRFRAVSHIGLHDDSLENMTEARDAYKAKFGRRAVTTGRVKLASEDWNNNEVNNNLTAPVTSVRSRSPSGMFALTTETSARYGRRAGLTDKPHKYTMRDNLKTPGPEAKFEAFSAHKEAFKPLPVEKRVNYHPKQNIKTFDDNYLLSLEENILKNKEKIRSVSLHSLKQETDEAIEVVGEDEILYRANNYTTTFKNMK